MITTQSVAVLNIVMENPGLNYEELEIKIKEIYGEESGFVNFMYLGDTRETSHLRILIKDIYCIEKKDNRYYYNEKLLLTNEKDLTQVFIRGFLEDLRKKAIKKEIEDHGENISH